MCSTTEIHLMDRKKEGIFNWKIKFNDDGNIQMKQGNVCHYIYNEHLCVIMLGLKGERINIVVVNIQ